MRHTISNGLITRRGFLARSGVAAISLALGSRFGLAATAGPKWTAANELAVTFTTAPSGSGRIQRPYLDELRRWYGAVGSDPALTPTSTGPTPNPGTYTVVWDGKNDKGALVEQGDYYVCVESARQNGPYSLVREKVTLGSALFKQKLGANAELKDVAVEFRKHA